ncbi:unnamed protein product [Rotaria sp. Silwood1]|nr:unnamed protein product [Rotaria sp. Silwood1]
MSRNNKVTPSKAATDSTTTSSPIPQEPDNEFNERQYLINYVNRKTCYHPLAAEEAEIINRQQKFAFQCNLWTLTEKRTIEWNDKPDDDKPVDGEEVGDLFDKKYEYQAPDTILSETTHASGPLNNTRKREVCPNCQGNGAKACYFCSGSGKKMGKDCPACHGQGSPACTKCSKQGHIIRWAHIKIEWRTVHTVHYYKDTFLPDKYIQNARMKTPVFDGDDECKQQSLDATFPHLLKEITQTSPVKFSSFVAEVFKKNHLNKVSDSTKIRRIKCLIQKLGITQITYQSGTLTNRHPREGK